jgi:hypothetical protein
MAIHFVSEMQSKTCVPYAQKWSAKAHRPGLNGKRSICEHKEGVL